MDDQRSDYTEEFYSTQCDGSRSSARKILPLVLQLVHASSIVDVGCGVGTWLGGATECGVEDVLGVDGDYVKRDLLEIPQDRFVARDLLQPLRLDRQFELVMSLEVAEHLPPEQAAAFVESLTRLGPVVLFSAAIPHQNGTFHLNEQFQDYWADLFRDRGYVAIDCIRRHVWADRDVEPWYAQNALLFVKEESLSEYPALAPERAATVDGFLSLVHPHIYR